MVLANLGLRFVLEMTGVLALGYWGFATGGGDVARLVAGIGAPIALVVVWGLLLAPRARSPLSGAQRTLAGTVLLEVCAAALIAAGATVAGLAFGAIILLNAAVILLASRVDATSVSRSRSFEA